MYNPLTPGWEIGRWLVLCARCGRKRVNTDISREAWTNLLVCKDTCNDGPRHPQEFVRPRPDDQSVPFTNPEPADVFVNVTFDTSGAHNTIPDGTFDGSLD